MGMIMMGTVAIIVEAIPVGAYFTAISENETPRKGPKKDPVTISLSWHLY